MNTPDFWDFMIGGGDELLNSELCPHCGAAIYLDQDIEWIDEENKTVKCPKCSGEVKIDG